MHGHCTYAHAHMCAHATMSSHSPQAHMHPYATFSEVHTHTQTLTHRHAPGATALFRGLCALSTIQVSVPDKAGVGAEPGTRKGCSPADTSPSTLPEAPSQGPCSWPGTSSGSPGFAHLAPSAHTVGQGPGGSRALASASQGPAPVPSSWTTRCPTPKLSSLGTAAPSCHSWKRMPDCCSARVPVHTHTSSTPSCRPQAQPSLGSMAAALGLLGFGGSRALPRVGAPSRPE